MPHPEQKCPSSESFLSMTRHHEEVGQVSVLLEMNPANLPEHSDSSRTLGNVNNFMFSESFFDKKGEQSLSTLVLPLKDPIKEGGSLSSCLPYLETMYLAHEISQGGGDVQGFL